MLTAEMLAILDGATDTGWVMEPEAKRLLSLAGIEVPPFAWARSKDEAIEAAGRIGFPLAAKVVSPELLHKSDAGGVVINIKDHEE